MGVYERLSNRSGFTLIEMVSALVIGMLTLGLILSVYMAGINNFDRQFLTWQTSRSTQMAMEYLSRDIRSAAHTVAYVGSVSTTAHSIALVAPSYDNNGIIPNSYDYIAYYVDRNGNLTRAVAANQGNRANEQERVLAEGITDLSFIYTCLDEFPCDGTMSDLTTSSPWSSEPMVTVNGQPATGYALNPNDDLIVFSSAPAAQSTVGIQYNVLPSDASALANVVMVSIQMSTMQTSGRHTSTSDLAANVRLRNKR